MTDPNIGLANAMLWLNEKAEEMIREHVALQWEPEDMQGNTK